jgi:iron complex outermembrane receptor protein
LTYLGRGVAKFGDHEIFAEITGSDATAAKRFSNVQITPNTTTQNYAYPSSGANYTTSSTDWSPCSRPWSRAAATDRVSLALHRMRPARDRDRHKDVRAASAPTARCSAVGIIGPACPMRKANRNQCSGPAITFRGTLRNGQPDPTRRARPAPPFPA